MAALLPAILIPADATAQTTDWEQRSLDKLPRNPAHPTTLPVIRQVGERENFPSSEQTGGYTVLRSRSGTGLSLPPRYIPQSLTVITRERIQDSNARSLVDVIRLTPGVSVRILDARGSTFSVRGFPVDNLLIDGTPVEWSAPWSAGETRDSTALYDRIEVVRGATGLLTGSGEPSAAINQVRKHADSQELTGSVGFGFGSRKHRNLHADISTPLSANGNIRGRVVAELERRHSFIDLEKDRRHTYYGVIDADLSPTTRLSVGASQQRDKVDGSMWGGLPAWYDDGSRTDWPRNKTTAPSWATWNTTSRTGFLNLDQQLGEWQLRLDLNHIRRESDPRLLWATGQPNRETGLGRQVSSRTWFDSSRTQNQISLQASRPFVAEDREHEIAFGLSRAKMEFNADARDAEGEAPSLGNFNTWDGSYPYPASWSTPYRSSASTTTQQAAWAVARLHLDDPLHLIVGSRITHWEREAPVARFNPTAYTLSHKRKITPYVGLVHDLSADASAYASYTTIFKPQERQDRTGRYLEPLQGKSYEIGLKRSALGGRLQSTLAVFKTRQDNLADIDGEQRVPGSISQAYRAVRGATTKGYELEVAGLVSPHWLMSLGWTQFKSKDPAGKELNTDKPRKLLKLATRYTITEGEAGLSLGGDLSWEGASWATVTNPVTQAEERLEQRAFVVLNLMAQYRLDRHWQLQLNIDNVLDKQYYSSVGFANGYSWGEPRRYTLQASYHF